MGEAKLIAEGANKGVSHEHQIFHVLGDDESFTGSLLFEDIAGEDVEEMEVALATIAGVNKRELWVMTI